MKPLVTIVGPTAIGKSKLALHLAQIFNGEIVNADSRQIYRYMDIGTAKSSASDQILVPHHLFDIINPNDEFSLALYLKRVEKVVAEIHSRGKVPFLVGGSGLYIWAFLEGWNLPEVSPDPELRCRLEEKAKVEGQQSLYEELRAQDPLAAERIDPRNVRRVVRALEVCYSSGKHFSEFQMKNPPPFKILIIGLTTKRDELYRKIDARVDEMVRRGLVEEVKMLREKGYGFDLPSMSSVGYREIGLYIQGEIDLPTAVQRIKYETHRLARHQYAWFKLSDSRIYWFEV